MCRCLHTFRAPVPVCTQKLSAGTTPLFYTSLHLVFHSALLPVDLQIPVFYKVLPCQIWGQIPFRHCCTGGIPNQIPHHQNPVTKNMPHRNRSSISILIQVIMKSTDTLKTSLIIMCLCLNYPTPRHSKSKKWWKIFYITMVLSDPFLCLLLFIDLLQWNRNSCVRDSLTYRLSDSTGT